MMLFKNILFKNILYGIAGAFLVFLVLKGCEKTCPECPVIKNYIQATKIAGTETKKPDQQSVKIVEVIKYLPDTTSGDSIPKDITKKPMAEAICDSARVYESEYSDSLLKIKVKSRVRGFLLACDVEYNFHQDIINTHRIDSVFLPAKQPVKMNMFFAGASISSDARIGANIFLLDKKDRLFGIKNHPFEKQPNAEFIYCIRIGGNRWRR